MPHTDRARLIRQYAGYSRDAFQKAFEILKKERGGKRGMTTDEEQDILRAAVVFAGAGLDAVAKELVREALPHLLERDPKAHEGLEDFAFKRLRSGDDSLQPPQA